MAAPGIPQGLNATQVGNNVNLAWQPPASDGGTTPVNYRIQHRGRYDGSGWTSIQRGSTVRSYVISNANLNEVLVEIRAYNADGESNWAEFVLPPDRPRNVSVEASFRRLVASWQAPSRNRGQVITGYKLQYRTADSVPWQTVGKGASDRTHILPTTGFKTYAFQVIATNLKGDSVSAPLHAPISIETIDKSGLHPAILTRMRRIL